jgi:hypothetical protein
MDLVVKDSGSQPLLILWPVPQNQIYWIQEQNCLLHFINHYHTHRLVVQVTVFTSLLVTASNDWWTVPVPSLQQLLTDWLTLNNLTLPFKDRLTHEDLVECPRFLDIPVTLGLGPLCYFKFQLCLLPSNGHCLAAYLIVAVQQHAYVTILKLLSYV